MGRHATLVLAYEKPGFEPGFFLQRAFASAELTLYEFRTILARHEPIRVVDDMACCN